MASFDFAGAVTKDEALKLVGFAAPETTEGFSSIELEDCAKGRSCLVVQKFEHQGAGEVDCGGE